MSEEIENKDNNNDNNNINSDEKMALKFPDWNLLPPEVLLKRKKHEVS